MTVQHAPQPTAAARRGVWEVIKDYMMTTDHKKIGLLYIATSIVAFAVAGLMAVAIRLQLALPDQSLLVGNTYNEILTAHAGIEVLDHHLVHFLNGSERPVG